MNRPLPCRDKIYIEGSYIIHTVCKDGDCIGIEAASVIADFVAFVEIQQDERRLNHCISNDWREFCEQGKIHESCLGPRWTMPFCYIGSEHQECFNAVRGLDVGCNVLAQSFRRYSDRFVSRIRQSGEYVYEYEVFVPHYQYYRAWGCNMQGVDLRPSTKNALVSQGDLRMLNFADNSIDFFTISMVVGPSNPACTILDAALCFSEIYRTSTSNALIYIADFIVTPAIVSLAIDSGFRVFINNSYSIGIPIGVFLVRRELELRRSSFFSILKEIESHELVFDRNKQQCIENRELLRRNGMPPRVTVRPTLGKMIS